MSIKTVKTRMAPAYLMRSSTNSLTVRLRLQTNHALGDRHLPGG